MENNKDGIKHTTGHHILKAHSHSIKPKIRVKKVVKLTKQKVIKKSKYKTPKTEKISRIKFKPKVKPPRPIPKPSTVSKHIRKRRTKETHRENRRKTKSKTTQSSKNTAILSKTKGNPNKNKNIKPIEISTKSYPTLFEWIASHKFYPLSAIYNEEEGKITLTFKIEKNGNITKIKLKKGSFEDLNKAALKILQNSSPIPKSILNSSNINLPAVVEINLLFKLQ